MNDDKDNALLAYVRQIGQVVEEEDTLVQRPYLFHRRTGLVMELETVYVDAVLSQNATNTQISKLRDLAFLVEWKHVQQLRDPKWIDPIERLFAGKPPLLAREIASLGESCKRTAQHLIRQRVELEGGKPNPRKETKTAVEAATNNRRLRTIKEHLFWLIDSIVEGGVTVEDHDFARAQLYKERLEREITHQLMEESLPSQPISLTKENRVILRRVLESNEVFRKDPNGVRDELIVRVLLEGFRAGELCCTKGGDLQPNHTIAPGLVRSRIAIVRRPNDPDEERVPAPSVKTLPGAPAIRRELSADLLKYILNERADAIKRRHSEFETPFLFVTHKKGSEGRACSQRNINRIVARLKSVAGLPEEIWPHVMRHTHLTEVSEIAAKTARSDDQTRRALIDRGRWGDKSKMPAHYTARATADRTDDLIEQRDRALDGA